MNRLVSALIAVLLVAAPASTASAQLLAAKDGPIVYGHYHVNASNIDEHKKFWITTLGGASVKLGTSPMEAIKFPNALVLLTAKAPSGPTKGSSFNHMGFSVTNLRALVDKVKANGFRMVTQEEAPPNVPVKDDIGQVDAGGVTGIAYAMGPDGVKVEIVEIKAQKLPIAHHHAHFFTPQNKEMYEWYMKVFGATKRALENPNFLGADLPGTGLNFSQSTEAVAPTPGRAVDHVGFEVKNLAEFMKKLEAQGIKIRVPYRQVPALNIAIAFIDDPWGTSIELTEGFDKVQ